MWSQEMEKKNGELFKCNPICKLSSIFPALERVNMSDQGVDWPAPSSAVKLEKAG